MKKKLITTAVLALALALTGCSNVRQGTPVEVTGLAEGESYDVVKLFEVDGITVYRFQDNGHTIYFTNRTGEVKYSYRKREGKVTKTVNIQTLCNDEQEANH